MVSAPAYREGVGYLITDGKGTPTGYAANIQDSEEEKKE